MSYFGRVRRRFVGSAREDAPEYVCESCNAGFDERWHVCPECGGYSIRHREWDQIP